MAKNVHMVCDVEMNGNIIGIHSLVSFGFVIIEPGLKRTYYDEVHPISDHYIPEAIAVSGFSFEDTKKFKDPVIAMQGLREWLEENCNGGRPVLWSDNNGNDAAWINYYFLRYLGENPFGWTSRRIGDLICGIKKDLRYQWKRERKTKHTHNALDDAFGNAGVILDYFEKNNIKY